MERAISDLEIAQKAAIAAGMKKPDSFETRNSTEAMVLRELYEEFVCDALCIIPWNFANEEIDLGSPIDPPPLTRYQAAYQIPVDAKVVRVRTVRLNGAVSRYVKEGDRILINALATDSVVMQYVHRAAVRDWPPYFSAYCILMLASFMAGAIARNGGLAGELTAQAEKALVRGRTINSQESTARGFALNKIRSTRMGGSRTTGYW